jgi:H+/Cl- antiporter ClcA
VSRDVEKDNKEKKPKHYIREFGKSPDTAAGAAAVSISMVVLAIVIGFIAGAVVWAALGGVNLLTELVWENLRSVFDVPWFPMVICTLGGVAIAFWTKYSGVTLNTLGEVLAQVKKTGGYKLEHFWKSLLSFALPLVCGGSIGPEAGISGIIASACTWIGDKLKVAGLKTRAIADISLSAVLTAVFGTPLMGIVATAEDGLSEEEIPDESGYTFRRPVKILLYTSSAVGALAGVVVIAMIPGLSGGLPRFDTMGAQGLEHLLAIPLALVGWILAMFYHTSTKAVSAIARKAGNKSGYLPIVCGVILGIVGMFLPNVLFAGEVQGIEIIKTWTTTSAVVLLLTGFLKIFVTPLCITFGWRGGQFFPTIFAGFSFGYGVSAITGIDPVLCVMSITTALVAGMTRRPVLTLALLLLCFPVENIVTLGFAALIGAFMPMPSAIDPGRPQRKHHKDEEASGKDDAAAN